jgi:hypothetical protein
MMIVLLVVLIRSFSNVVQQTVDFSSELLREKHRAAWIQVILLSVLLVVLSFVLHVDATYCCSQTVLYAGFNRTS